MGLCLTGNTPLDCGLVYTIDTKPCKHASHRDGPERVTSQRTEVKAKKEIGTHIKAEKYL